jgi:hypothetical protein
MKRVVIGVITVLSLALGAGVAQAHGPGDGGHWGHWDGGDGQSSSQVVAVAGVITSVDQSASSFDANAFVPQGEGYGWHHGFGDNQGNGQQGNDQQGSSQQGSSGAGQGDNQGSSGSGSSGGGRDFHPDWMGGNQPSLTAVTITTDGSTTFKVDGQDGTIANLAPGDRFVALFNGSPTDSLQTLVSSAPVAVFAHTPPNQRQLYAFVGTVSGVNAAAGTVSVQVSNSVPSGLVPAGSGPATFTVSPSTMILGGTSTNGLFGGSLNDVSVGDVVAGGLIGPAGETLTQVESSPLQVLVDFPAATTSMKSSSVRRAARQRAMTQALTLFGYKTRSRTTGKGHKARSGKSHAHHGRRGTSGTRTHAKR